MALDLKLFFCSIPSRWLYHVKEIEIIEIALYFLFRGMSLPKFYWFDKYKSELLLRFLWLWSVILLLGLYYLRSNHFLFTQKHSIPLFPLAKYYSPSQVPIFQPRYSMGCNMSSCTPLLKNWLVNVEVNCL